MEKGQKSILASSSVQVVTWPAKRDRDRANFYRRVRAFLDLRQIDVERATGIPTWKLSAAEVGRVALSELEEGVLVDFLRDRLRIVHEADGGWPEEIVKALTT